MLPGNRAAEARQLAREAIERLRRQGGPELLAKLLESYRLRTPERLAEARTARESGDRESLARVFHSLKSSSALVGASAMEAHARAAELAQERGDAAEVGRRLAALGQAFAALVPALSSASGAPPPARAPGRDAELPRVAVVEDNEDNRVLTRVLLSPSFQAEEYVDGASALQAILLVPPRLVLLDLSLPGINGMEILKHLKAALPRLPVIAMTAHAMRGDRERLLAAGFDDYIPKPILDASDFLARVQRLAKGEEG
jgi:CheY-like chemotaxis protein